MMDPKYQKMMEEGEAAVDIQEADTMHQHNSLPASYVKSLVISFLVSTCCCWLLGGIAFILALFGQRSAFAGDIHESRRLKRASYIVSIIGFLTGLVILIVLMVHIVSFMKAINRFDPHLLSPTFTISPQH